MGIAADPIGRAHLGPYAAQQPEHVHGFVSRAELLRVILVGVAAALSWAGIMPRFGGTAVLTVAVVAAGGYPVFRDAFENLLSRRMTMELSMTLALAAALAIGEFTTALFILFFVLGAEILEELTVDRGRKAIQNLLDLLPKTALVRRGETIQELAIHLVNPGTWWSSGPRPKSRSTAGCCWAIPPWTNPASPANPCRSINCRAPGLPEPSTNRACSK